VNIVAIETATETVGVAVRTAEGVEAEFVLTGRRRHVESLTPALDHLLQQVGLRAADLGAVAVDLGPGLFTGLRVGVAAAKGLAQALGIGVVGLSSLDILLRAGFEQGLEGRLLAAIDARRGEVFATLADLGPDGTTTAVLGPALLTPALVAEALAAAAGPGITAIGDGTRRYADQLGVLPGVRCVVEGLTWPPPGTLLQMALERLAANDAPVRPELVVPIYMRDADAISNFTTVSS
jgi:tRNA threonylcarbamoyladenosine biosynthesis protein TsaB